jgi:guanine nucleotide-binding protein subunit beta-2-like 1 protein
MTCRQIFSGHTKDVLSVSFSHDNRMIFSGAMDKTLRFWNIKGENRFVSTNFNGWVSSICHVKQDDKEKLLAVGSWDSKVRIFDSELAFNRGIDSSSDYAVVSMSSDVEGEYLFVGQKNGTVKIWNLARSDKELDTLKTSFDVNADLNALSYESKYFTVLALATSKGISIRDIKSQSEIYSRSFGGKGAKEGKEVFHACLSLAWDESKTYLFAGFADGVIRVYKFVEEKN